MIIPNITKARSPTSYFRSTNGPPIPIVPFLNTVEDFLTNEMFLIHVSFMLYKTEASLRIEVIILLQSSHFSAEEKLVIRELKRKIRSAADPDEKKELEQQLNTIMEKAFIKKQLRRRNELK